MATAPTYCTHRQLKDIFPQVDSFDTKRSIHHWTQIGGSGNIWRAFNTGLVTQLFKDGINLGQDVSSGSGGAQWSADIDTTLDSYPDSDTALYSTISYSGMVLESESEITVGDIGRFSQSGVDSEEFALVTAVNTTDNKITVERGKRGTTPYPWSASGGVFTDHFSLGEANQWMYSSDDDELIVYSSTDPNDVLFEAGEDFNTLITRTLANASRFVDSKLDPNLPKEQLKDKEGNFDYIIQRTTGLIGGVFLIRAHDPTSEIATAMMEEAQANIDSLNNGSASLSWQTTGDSSKGIVRDVTYTTGSIRPVDTRGKWNGTFDIIKVKVVTGGALGTATYSVWTKGEDKLGINEGYQVVTEEKIDGDYQPLAGGLQIRFGGSTKSSVATANNEWEIEVSGWREEVDNSANKFYK